MSVLQAVPWFTRCYWDFNGIKDGMFFFVRLFGKMARYSNYQIKSGEAVTPANDIKLTGWDLHRKKARDLGRLISKKNRNQIQEYIGGSFENDNQCTPPPQYNRIFYLDPIEGPGKSESESVGYRKFIWLRATFLINFWQVNLNAMSYTK